MFPLARGQQPVRKGRLERLAAESKAVDDLDDYARELLAAHVEVEHVVSEATSLERPFEVEQRGKLWVPKVHKVRCCNVCRTDWPCKLSRLVAEFRTQRAFSERQASAAVDEDIEF